MLEKKYNALMINMIEAYTKVMKKVNEGDDYELDEAVKDFTPLIIDTLTYGHDLAAKLDTIESKLDALLVKKE